MCIHFQFWWYGKAFSIQHKVIDRCGRCIRCQKLDSSGMPICGCMSICMIAAADEIQLIQLRERFIKEHYQNETPAYRTNGSECGGDVSISFSHSQSLQLVRYAEVPFWPYPKSSFLRDSTLLHDSKRTIWSLTWNKDEIFIEKVPAASQRSMTK